MPVERVVVDDEDHHLTLSELDPVLEDIKDPVEVHWSGSKEDLLLWEKWRERTFVLYVPSASAADRARWVTGTPLDLPPAEVESAKKDISARTGSAWRARAAEIGSARGVLLLASVTGGSIRAGKNPRSTLSVVSDCLFRGVNPVDLDVLLRLRVRA